ncbi:Hsp20/alpha crystallin family protein [Achromobacter aloeverae]|uniref:Heat-shock protein Hsp20 n=1 Tax=Achromobacter aloeverae TaxID=1750518 RepID=A0A4Q1HC23_9BURK|nr:Hsp20/alpha crystallin family protein [Achromobacter aloeverae]RXN83200.1 heat-shock protein Hsp20 [Achromobacter aloeverae]
MFQSLLDLPNGLFAEFDRLQRTLTPAAGSIRAVPRAFPAINIGQNAESVDIDVFVPGIAPAQLDVQVDRGLLTISGERRDTTPADGSKVSIYASERYTGRFKRAISLSDDLDTDKVSAQYRDGVLRISVPRRQPAQPRRVAIQ